MNDIGDIENIFIDDPPPFLGQLEVTVFEALIHNIGATLQSLKNVLYAMRQQRDGLTQGYQLLALQLNLVNIGSHFDDGCHLARTIQNGRRLNKNLTDFSIGQLNSLFGNMNPFIPKGFSDRAVGANIR